MRCFRIFYFFLSLYPFLVDNSALGVLFVYIFHMKHRVGGPQTQAGNAGIPLCISFFSYESPNRAIPNTIRQSQDFLPVCVFHSNHRGRARHNRVPNAVPHGIWEGSGHQVARPPSFPRTPIHDIVSFTCGQLTGQVGPLIWTPTMPMQRRSTLVGEAFRGHVGARVLNVRPPSNFVFLPPPQIEKKRK